MRTWTKPLPAVTTDIRLRFLRNFTIRQAGNCWKKLNVMLEKPMTLTAAQSAELVELAQRTGARLMVGHVLLFHPAYRKIKEVIDSGRLGKLFYLYSNRLNLGTVRTEESVFPSFAPHDISVLDYLTGASACRIEAKGAKFLQDRVYDSTLVQLEYPGNVHATSTYPGFIPTSSSCWWWRAVKACFPSTMPRTGRKSVSTTSG